ncbi:MAG TPA: chemotaxis response regulator protein-glutamate methylesterase [Kofleriaceae bacterium]|nr:chemotaxis response regulator protein-glutamate methylesterase [Kofleriaceae bacterium]
MKKIRVLVVDDSLFMRAAIKKLLAKDPRLEVVGEAKDGRDGVDKVLALEPDVCTMDFNMPTLDGAGAVREIMRLRPTPVVMLSAHTREGARETFEALAAGAVDFVSKPAGEVSAEMAGLAERLIPKVVAAAQAVPHVMAAPSDAPRPPPRITLPRTVGNLGPKIAVVAVSTGGPAALGRFLPRLPADTSIALVVVQHLPAGFTAALAERLDAICAIRVREAADGDAVEAGTALIAPGDQHLSFSEGGAVRIIEGPEVNGVRPAADVTMRSAAQVFGRRCIGVVMTGMGRDGTEGLKLIKAAGGATLAQDQASSVIYGMPRSAIEGGFVDRVVVLDDLADAVRRA